jgi:hypothetical protein
LSADALGSLAVAIGAASIHVLTFFVDIPFAHGFVALFTLAAMLCFAVMLMSQNRPSAIAVVRAVPAVATVGFLALSIYFMINFFSLIDAMGPGSPVDRDGEFLLMDHGRLVRHLDRAEFIHLQTIEARGLLGHAVIFSLIAALGNAVRDGRTHARRKAG